LLFIRNRAIDVFGHAIEQIDGAQEDRRNASVAVLRKIPSG
jgi:hypothetical protein